MELRADIIMKLSAKSGSKAPEKVQRKAKKVLTNERVCGILNKLSRTNRERRTLKIKQRIIDENNYNP